MSLKWWETENIVSSEASKVATKARTAFDYLQEMERQRGAERAQKEAEREAARAREQQSWIRANQQRIDQALIEQKKVREQEDLQRRLTAGQQLADLGIEPTKAAIRAQQASGYTWGKQAVEQAQSEAQAKVRKKVVTSLISQGGITSETKPEDVESFIQAGMAHENYLEALKAEDYESARYYKSQEDAITEGIEQSEFAKLSPYQKMRTKEGWRKAFSPSNLALAGRTLTGRAGETAQPEVVAQQPRVPDTEALQGRVMGGLPPSKAPEIKAPSKTIDFSTQDEVNAKKWAEERAKHQAAQQGTNWGDIDPIEQQQRVDLWTIWVLRNDLPEVYGENETSTLPLEQPKPPEPKSAFQKYKEFMEEPRVTAGGRFWSVPDILGVIGMVGSVAYMGYGAYQSLANIINFYKASHLFEQAYKTLPKNYPIPPKSLVGTVGQAEAYKAYQRTNIYSQLQKAYQGGGIKGNAYKTIDAKLFHAYQAQTEGNTKLSEQILDELRRLSSLGLGVKPGAEIVPYTPPTMPPVAATPSIPAMAATPSAPTGVPTMITTAMQNTLHTMGYSSEVVAQMTPAIAWGILSGTGVTAEAGKVAAEQAVKAGGLVKVTEAITEQPKALFAKGWKYNQAEKAWYEPVEAVKPTAVEAEITAIPEAPVTPEVTELERYAIKTYGVVGKLSPYQGSYILKDGGLLDLDDAGHRELMVNDFGRETGGLRLRVAPEEVNVDFIADRTPTIAQMKQIKNLTIGKKVTYSIVDANDSELVGATKVSFVELEKVVNDYYAKPAAIPKAPETTAVAGVETGTPTEWEATTGATEDWITSTEEFEAMKVAPEVGKATPEQIKKIHAIAASKKYITTKGLMKPQYRRLAKSITGKTSAKEMTRGEASQFIEALGKLPEPTIRGGKVIPPSIPISKKVTAENFFGLKFGEPTPVRFLTSQTYYAEKLGVKPLVEPLELGKMRFDLEYRALSKEVAVKIGQIDKLGKTSFMEKLSAKRANEPTRAVARMRDLLDKYEDPPEFLTKDEREVFTWFRNLNKTMLEGENKVRALLDIDPIPYRKAYVRHVADGMAQDILLGKYPFPEGLKYWSEKVVGKKIFNPMELQRKLAKDLGELFTKDLKYATNSMLWTGLKEIHLSQPLRVFTEQMGALSKDLPRYEGMSPEELEAIRGVSVMPASTKRWVIDYVNTVIKGQQTETDAGVNRLVTETGLKGLFNKVLKPFGRTVGARPVTHAAQISGRLVISGVMGAGKPKQLIRNLFQNTQNLALYGVKPCLKAFLPANEQIQALIDKSLFYKSYTGYEELPAELMGKIEKAWLLPYGRTAAFNAKTAMKAAYWDTLDLITNPKYAKYGWADPARTYQEAKGVLYDSEEDKLLKEMEFGAGCTQFQYIPLGMPEVFRHKALIPLTRLQSWWMNYVFKFSREAVTRGLKGETGYGAKLPWSRRLGYLRYLILGGTILKEMGYEQSFLIGVLPHFLSPAGQLMLGMVNYIAADNDYQRKKAETTMKYSWKAFIPGSGAWQDWDAVWSGEKPLKSLFLYGTEPEEPEEPTEEQARKEYIKGLKD